MKENSPNILIIDDDVTIRKLISFHLKSNNFNTFEAENASIAFDLLDQNEINLVLCDVTMEEMDGFTFCRKVRENDKTRIIPFIFVTAKSSIEDKTKALESGGDDYVVKPFDMNDLMIKINALMRRSDIYKAYGLKKDLESSIYNVTTEVLLVDDDESLAKLFQFSLNKAGFKCHIAYSAIEGLSKAKEILPTIIISDIMMPIMDGFAFRNEILKTPELKNIPFIFLTAKADEQDILNGYDLGIADYVLKTQGPRLIVAKVSAMIKSLQKERQKVLAELNKAADTLRLRVVPERAPEFNGYHIDHWHQPFEGIPGGDFLDYFQLDDHNLAIILGDVMGKKWGAWFFAFAYAGYIRSAFRIVLQNEEVYSPSELLRKVNRSIHRDAKVSEIFTTLSILIINNKNHSVSYSGAGDLPLLKKSGRTGEISTIQSQGLLLGFSENGMYDDVIFELEKNDSLFLFTDGIMEAENQYHENFGKAELFKTIAYKPLNGDSISIFKDRLGKFTENNFMDDISLINIQRN